jgi:methylated-DNA-[protein]-cysteine S-methyltransferase
MGHHDLSNRSIRLNGHLARPVPTRFDLTPDQMMTTPAPSGTSSAQAGIPSNLAGMAAEPNCDPCDIAESAMPDLVFGDLAKADEEWVRNHTITCNYCSNILQSLEHVCSSLDKCEEDLGAKASRSRPASTICLGLPEARYGYMETPVGDVLVAASDAGVVEVSYLDHTGSYESLRDLERRGYLVYERQQTVQPVIDQLGEYFSHARKTFDLPVDLGGVTDFTRSVLKATNRIPYGKVQTYGDVASEIGKPKASRAVGNALGRNPIPVIIPCHRVILSSGAMGWYTGGPAIKRTLLGIEGIPYAASERSAQQSLSVEL